MYLEANPQADVAYEVHQTARFTHRPKHSHALAIKCIVEEHKAHGHDSESQWRFQVIVLCRF